MQTFELSILAPIPVGHRAELTWYKVPQTGMLSGTKLDSFPHAPVVRDLQTNIIYGPVEPFWQRGAAVELPRGRPLQLQWEPLPGCQIEYQLAGKVVACRIGTYYPPTNSHASFRVQTTLVIDPAG